MPRGVYIRTEKAKEIIRRNMDKGREISWKLPRTEVQLTTCCENGRKAGLSNKGRSSTQKQIESGRKMGQADSIDCHHRDLQHGAIRPDDVIYMTHSEHSKLHAEIHLKGGTHNFLPKNRSDAMR